MKEMEEAKRIMEGLEHARRDVRETVNCIRNELDHEKAEKTLLQYAKTP